MILEVPRNYKVRNTKKMITLNKGYVGLRNLQYELFLKVSKHCSSFLFITCIQISLEFINWL